MSVVKLDRPIRPELSKIPDTNRIITRQQHEFILFQRQQWQHLGSCSYLDFTQGFAPDHPLDRLEPLHRDFLQAKSEFYSGILQVLIYGFRTAEARALSERRDFTFSTPRELFVEVCRCNAEAGLVDVLEDRNTTRRGLLDGLRQLKKFFW